MKADVIYFLLTSLEAELAKVVESDFQNFGNNTFLVQIRVMRTAIKNLKKFF